MFALKRKLVLTKQGNYILTVPKQLVQLKGWQPGDSLTFKDQKGSIVIEKD
ncbi:AbrB/MazE/SpoVT family DNA-binding domain-containing protein [Candidatus Woesearchaeota archaeon]|nr:AbrB/MazE/SpoVT family DNA-binding domain-containing protein [Candidatus Woesearchaeota archaeon]